MIVQRNHVKRQLDENKNTPSERICPIVHILSYNIEDIFFQKWSASLRKIQFVMLFKTNDRILNCIPTFTWHKIIPFYKNFHTNFFSMTLFNLFYFFALLAYSNYFYLPLLIQTSGHNKPWKLFGALKKDVSFGKIRVCTHVALYLFEETSFMDDP